MLKAMRLGIALLALACLSGCAHLTEITGAPDQRIAVMPLAVTPIAGAGDTMVVLYSGDGGWAPLDRGLAAGFNAAGLPTVGVNSLRYFWRRRTPKDAAADLAALITRYGSLWSRPRVILVGYSFGADALPAIVPQLPLEIRARIRLLGLVSIFKEGELQFQLGSWFGHVGQIAYPTSPLVAALRGLPMVCVYGADEIAPACPALPSDLIAQVRLPGGHGYDGAYGNIVGAILKSAG